MKLNSTVKATLITLGIILLIALVIFLGQEDYERQKKANEKLINHQELWVQDFCAEQGYEGYELTSFWTRAYCRKGGELRELELIWEYEDEQHGFMGSTQRSRIKGAKWVI